MEEKLEKIVQRINDLKERYKNNESKHKLLLGIAVFILSPCAFILKININSVIKIILTLFVALFMLYIILVVSPILLLYHIWFRSNLKNVGKVVITFLIALFFVLCYVGATRETNKSGITSTSDEVKEPYTVDDSTKEDVTEGVTKETTTIVQQTVGNGFIQLSNDKEAYLLLLEILGNCYEIYDLSESLFTKMQENQTVANLVKEVLDYKYENNELLPDFNESFSLFWTFDIANNNPEIITALQKSFNVSYDVINDIWLLTDKKDKETTTETTTEFKWLSAIGNLYSGVELYIVTDDTTTLYGVVTDYDTKLHRVQVYLKEADGFMWFPTREESFLNKLKVRSDDPRLPN